MNTFSSTKSGRIDKILAETLDISRNQIEKLIKDGLVSVNGKTVTKTSFKVEEGDEIAYAFK
ncbi:MAG: S4 domain-containing protein, partial [Sulfurovum sp.]|nr:S4 domain-containing protein [Sulfurovum sp.]